MSTHLLTETDKAAIDAMVAAPLYAFDIETTGLDPRTDTVLSWAMYGPDLSIVVDSADEAELLDSLTATIARRSDCVIVGWNSAVFDFPFLAVRYELLGQAQPWLLSPNTDIIPKYDPIPGFAGAVNVEFHHNDAVVHADIAPLYKHWAKTNDIPWNLKPVATALGLDPVVVDASATKDLSVSERVAYNLSDVVITQKLALLLTSTI